MLHTIGMRESAESAAIYHRIEVRHAMITRWLFRVIRLAVSIGFLIPNMDPISYASFNYPKPDQWILPLGIQWGRANITKKTVHFTTARLNLDHFSSIYPRGIYLGYFVDLFIEVASTPEFFAVMIASISLFVDACAYTKEMVDDLSFRMAQIGDHFLDAKKNGHNRLCQLSVLAAVNEIRFHYNIVG